MPLKGPKSVKRSRMIRETAHNATAVRGETNVLKPLWMRDVGAFARRDQSPNVISPNELPSACDDMPLATNP